MFKIKRDIFESAYSFRTRGTIEDLRYVLLLFKNKMIITFMADTVEYLVIFLN